MEKVCMYEQKDKQIITLSIQEIVNDFYILAQEEGFLSGIHENGDYDADACESYYDKMLELAKKYIPNYKKYMSKGFFDESVNIEEKGLMLSQLLEENFKEIFYKLV